MMREFINYQSPIGLIKIAIEDESVVKLIIANNDETASEPTSRFAKKVITELNDYFEGKIHSFSFPIKLEGTDFQKRVWSELQKIPYGETISYQELAKRSGNPKAYRAAGTANGKNPVCIVVPCHRVIHADGGIGGYAYGTEVKERLLNLEKSGKL
ncbi:MAG: methylated-DNA--[protein]-cysteine S-methyltransferase [Bacteroidales bacterium]